MKLAEDERIAEAAFSADGRIGLIGGDGGEFFREGYASLYMTEDGGRTWAPINGKLAASERVAAAAFNANGEVGMFVGDSGSLFITTDGGKTWKSSSSNLGDRGLLREAAFSADGRIGLIVSRHGSELLTQDDEMNWISSKLFGDPHWFDGPSIGSYSPVQVAHHSAGFVAEAEDGYYVLAARPELAGWKGWSLERIHSVMDGDETFRDSSAFRKLLTSYGSSTEFDGGRTTGEKAPTSDAGGGASNKALGDQGPLNDFLDEATVIRLVTVTIVFFLAQVLVRLYQYCLRLSSFWDSRADAVLLDHGFAYNKSKGFATLVNALSPETYDFKPPPRTLLDGLRLQRRDQGSE